MHKIHGYDNKSFKCNLTQHYQINICNKKFKTSIKVSKETRKKLRNKQRLSPG